MTEPTPEELQEERAKALELRRVQREQDFRRVLATPEGRRLLWHIIRDLSGAYRLSYAGSGQAEDTAFREGKRAVGLELMAEVQAIDARLWLETLLEQTRSEAEAVPK